GEQGAGAQRRQRGLRAVLERQQMPSAAAGGNGQHDLVRQRLFVEQVQDGLQAAGKRGLINGRGDQQRLRLRNAPPQVAGGRAVVAAFDQVLGGQVVQSQFAAWQPPRRQAPARIAQQRR